MLTFKHSGAAGDIIYSLPTVISISEENPGVPVHFYIDINKPSKNYLGSKHPLRNLRFDEKYFNQIKPLLESQDYINKVEIYKNESLSVDLDEFRALGIDYSKGHIPRWYFYLFKSSFDLSTPWIFVNPNQKFEFIVNRTSRYRNLNISYSFLKDYNVTFIGLEDEYEDFKNDVPNASYYQPRDFLELAQIISGCKLFIGNQSLCYAIAEAVKVPRLLEICPFANNVMPHGLKAWDFYQQNAFEYIARTEIEKVL